MSLQAAIPEGDSEEKPLKPTDRQAINHKIKNFRIWKRNLRSWRVVSRKRMPSSSLKSLGKSSVGKSVDNASMKNAWEWLQNCKVTLTRLWWGQRPKKKTQENVSFYKNKETFVLKKRRVKENKAKARKRRRERAEKNCERVFSAISHLSLIHIWRCRRRG